MPVSPVLDTNDTVPQPDVICPIHETGTGAPELSSAGFAWQGLATDPDGTHNGNGGLYGVNLNYVFGAINTDMVSSHAAYLRAVGRDTGSPFWGAGRIVQPAGYPDRKINKLSYGATSDFTNGTPPEPPPVIVPPNTLAPPVDINVLIAVGGGAPLPVNLELMHLIQAPP